MAQIVLRLVKGVPLTNAEVDGNFSNINLELGIVNANVGSVSNLLTVNKDNVVEAINEIFESLEDFDFSNVQITGGTITNTTWNGNTIPVSQGGTGATTDNIARTNLGLAIGSDVQAYSANLDNLGSLDFSANNIIIGDGAGWVVVDINDYVPEANLDALGTMSEQDSDNVQITGGTINLGNGNVSAQYFFGDGGLLSNISATGGEGVGSGLFNTKISDAVGYSIDNTLSNAYIAPSTVDTRYIVHSIHVTNIDGSNMSNVSGEFGGDSYSELISFAHTVPVPKQSAVDMLKKPKVLQPNDFIRIVAEDNNMLHAVITLEKSEDTALFGKGVDIVSGGMYYDLHAATSNCVIESVLLSNDDGVNDVKATVVWTDSTDVIQGYYCFEMVIPADSTVEVLEQPKFIPNTHKIRVYSNIGGRLEAMIAGKNIEE